MQKNYFTLTINMIYYGRSNYATIYSTWNFLNNCVKDRKKSSLIFSNLPMIRCTANMSLSASKRHARIELHWWKHLCFSVSMFCHRIIHWWLHSTNIPISYSWSTLSIVMNNFFYHQMNYYVRSHKTPITLLFVFFSSFSSSLFILAMNNNACRWLRLTFFLILMYIIASSRVCLCVVIFSFNTYYNLRAHFQISIKLCLLFFQLNFNMSAHRQSQTYLFIFILSYFLWWSVSLRWV